MKKTISLTISSLAIAIFSITFVHQTIAGCFDLCNQEQDRTWAVCLSSKECVDKVYIEEVCCFGADGHQECETGNKSVNAYLRDTGQCIPWCCDYDGVCGDPSGSSTPWGTYTAAWDQLGGSSCTED